MIRKVLGFLGTLSLCACGYHYEQATAEGSTVSISVPYIKGDPEGKLNAELIKALSSTGQFECVQSGGEWVLEASIVADSDDRIGYRFDRDPTTGHLRDNIVGTENRQTLTAVVSVVDANTREMIVGPEVVKASADYDYVDSNSIRDLTFLTPNGTFARVLDFSLGQLDSVEGAHDDSTVVAYRVLAQRITDGFLAKVGSRLKAEKGEYTEVIEPLLND